MAPNNQENGVDPDEIVYSWDELNKHNNANDLWVAIEGYAYDLTKFQHIHPGLSLILNENAGEDCTRFFKYNHVNQAKPRRYMGAYRKGRMEEVTNQKYLDMDKDLDECHALCKKMGLFNPGIAFNTLWVGQSVVYLMISFGLAWKFPDSWLAVIISGLMYGLAAIHLAFHMHDFGHRSVTQKFWLDHCIQTFLLNFMQGFSAKFWSFYHARHHAKPNMLNKDPTIKINELFFVVGKERAAEVAQEVVKEKKTPMPYAYQHLYWFIVGVPLYIPVYYQMASVIFGLRRKEYYDLAWMLTFFIWYFYVFGSLLGFTGALIHFIVNRQLMTHWFVWTSLSNHLALHSVHDTAKGYSPSEGGYHWLELQMLQTINLPGTRFWSWYHGGLNFQLEHHIFPQLPRDKLPVVAPLVEEICNKHGLPYRVLSTYDAYKQVYTMFRESGERFSEIYLSALSGQ